MAVEKRDKVNSVINHLVDKIFSLNKIQIFVLILALIAFVLRTLMAIRRRFSGDEAVHGVHAIGFINSGKLQIMDESGVWFWLTDFFTKIFTRPVRMS